MTLLLKPNPTANFQFSFLDEEKYPPFLKQNHDLIEFFCGEPLNELISTPSTYFLGYNFEKTKILLITNYIYESILAQKMIYLF